MEFPVKCYRCKAELNAGDEAYEQDIESIKIVGSKVTQTIEKVMVCTTCAE